MANCYGVRQVITEDENGNKTIAEINFSLLKNINYEVNVDIGNASQFSEVAQLNTLDKLFMNNVIDSKLYIDSIPSKYVPNKGKISQYVEEISQHNKELMKQQMMMQNQPSNVGNGGLIDARL